MLRKFKWPLFILFLLLLLWRILLGLGSFTPGSTVNGVTLQEGRTLKEVRAQIDNLRPRPIRILGPRGSRSVTVDLRPRTEEAIREAQGDFWSRFLGQKKTVDLRWRVPAGELQKVYRAAGKDFLAREARPVWKGLRLSIRPGRAG